MSMFTFLVGSLLVLAIMVDVIGSTFLPARFRFIAFRVEVSVWRSFSYLSDRLQDQRLRTWAGPVILFSIFVVWIGGAWVAWTVVFCASPEAVVPLLPGGQAANFWDRAYYVGGLLSTLGVGDFASGNSFWRMLSVIASLVGLTIITLSISNFVTVVFALSETRAIAAELSSLGERGTDMLKAGWNGRNFEPLVQRFDSILSRIFVHAERASAFGLINHFVHSERSRAIAPALAALDDAIVLLRFAVAEDVRPHALTLCQMERAIALAIPELVRTAAAPWPVLDGMRELAAIGIPIASHGHEGRPTHADHLRRTRLAGWLLSNGWDWNGVAPNPHPAAQAPAPLSEEAAEA